MKALVFEAPQRAVVTDIDHPRSAPTTSSSASHAVGICHSDFELYEGRYIIPVSYPIIPGHEWCGEVVETGASVVGLPPGDAVVGECVVGPAGATTSASRSTAPTPNTSRRAASGCTSCRRISRSRRARWSSRSRSPTTPPSCAGGDRRGGHRGGPRRRADRPAVRDGRRREQRGRCDRRAAGGSTRARLSSSARGPRSTRPPTTSPTAVAEATRGRGFDVVIEAAGSPAAMAQALEIAGHEARVVYVGIDIGAKAPAQLGLIQSKALRIRGLIGSVGLWPRAIRFIASGVVDPTAIVTATFPLHDALAALDAARDTANNIKVHLATSA